MCYCFAMSKRDDTPNPKIVTYVLRLPGDLKERIIRYGRSRGLTGNSIGIILLTDAIVRAEHTDRETGR